MLLSLCFVAGHLEQSLKIWVGVSRQERADTKSWNHMTQLDSAQHDTEQQGRRLTVIFSGLPSYPGRCTHILCKIGPGGLRATQLHRNRTRAQLALLATSRVCQRLAKVQYRPPLAAGGLKFIQALISWTCRGPQHLLKHSHILTNKVLQAGQPWLNQEACTLTLGSYPQTKLHTES